MTHSGLERRLMLRKPTFVKLKYLSNPLVIAHLSIIKVSANSTETVECLKFSSICKK